MKKLLALGMCIIFFSDMTQSKGQVEPSLNTSISITPSATTRGENEVFYALGAQAIIPLSNGWYFTPGYSLGINTVSSTVEYFSSPEVSITYETAPNWSIKQALVETFSHNSSYHSEKAKFSFIYSVPDPSTLVFYLGPSYFQDTDQNQKWGGYTGLSGNFTHQFFWYLDAGISTKINKTNQNSTDQTATVGAGYNISEGFSFSLDATAFRGPSGIAVQQQNKQASITAKPSKTTSKNTRDTNSTEVTFSASLDYNF